MRHLNKSQLGVLWKKASKAAQQLVPHKLTVLKLEVLDLIVLLSDFPNFRFLSLILIFYNCTRLKFGVLLCTIQIYFVSSSTFSDSLERYFVDVD